jgi:NTP pyrophosphatase (non-canonical NTP hydrolase)
MGLFEILLISLLLIAIIAIVHMVQKRREDKLSRKYRRMFKKNRKRSKK